MAKGTQNILLVEDDPSLAFVVQDNLEEAGYRVRLGRDGMEGLKLFGEGGYDLCVLDIMLPKKDGFTLAEDIRRIDREVPIVFLTAKSMTSDKIKGFKKGGDDYITKPFSHEELLLRIEAILKRSRKERAKEDSGNIINIGKYRFDLKSYLLEGPDFQKSLTRKEAGILKLLCDHRNNVLERELVTTMVWGDDNYFVGRSLDVFITKLRKYLSKDPEVKISNVHGVGFKLEAPAG